jgi:hypothetical protein
MAVLQIIVERPTDMACSFLFSLDCYSKQAGDESHLTQNIPLAHSFHLSFAMFIISYPCKVLHAVSNEKKPIPGLVNRLMNR